MTAKRIFISFAAPEDNYARDFLVGQARNNHSPFEFVDMSVKEPWSDSWKTSCRTKIKGCDGFIALLSKYTVNSLGAKWEMKCAKEEGIPLIGLQISSTAPGTIPPELNNQKVIYWTWDEIAKFIRSL
ncbi:MAG TPA: TIR domain-containing protein [Pyrinomonadaceae bacterium]|jgi:hypothetical protein